MMQTKEELKIVSPVKQLTYLRTLIHATGDLKGPKAADWTTDGNRDPDKVDFSTLPEETFAIQFFDRLVGSYELNGNEIIVASGQCNISPIIFTKGKLLTPEKLKIEYPTVADITIKQMETYDTGHCVYVFNAFKPFYKDQYIFWNKLGQKLYKQYPYIKRNEDGTYERYS